MRIKHLKVCTLMKNLSLQAPLLLLRCFRVGAFGKCGGDSGAAFGHQLLGIEAAFAGPDGFVDGERDASGSYVVCGTRHGPERAVDGDWHNRQLEFAGKHERAAFERNEASVPGARAFGEDDHTHAVLQPFLRLFYRGLDAVYGAVVDETYPALRQANPTRGIFSRLFFISHLKLWLRYPRIAQMSKAPW